MKKTLKKSLSLVLAVVMLVSCMVFSLPNVSAATYPQTLHNGDDDVNYTADDALQGKYLVEVDVVKFSPNYMLAPAAIKSEAGDIIFTYRPSNGLDAEKAVTLEDIIPANAFNFDGEGQRAYYAVVEGFPTKATASVKKTNLSANDSGIFTGIKIWDCTIGTFNTIYDPLKVQRENGAETASLMFSSIETLNQYYPYAKEGSASGGNLTLPANITNPTVSDVNFAVTDQWGVTMISPKINAPSIAGLTFSQNNNIVTIKGTGDANYYSSNNNYRDVTVKATYATANENAAGLGEISQVCRITNSTTKTYAPTYDNRTKAGLSLWFVAGSTANPDKFNLNSSYNMTTTNYLKIKNNSTRTATINSISSPNSGKFKFVFDNNTTLAAGATLSVKIQDLQSASANYSIDADVTYTLEGLYNASTGSLVSLATGSTVPCIYEASSVPEINIYHKPLMQRKVDVNVQLVTTDQNGNAGKGILKQTSKDDGKEECTWAADYYINRDEASTYSAAKLGFKFIVNYGNSYSFQSDKAGTYQFDGEYDSAATFGFATASHASSAVTEKVATSIGSTVGATKTLTFVGNIFKGSTETASPAKINFSKMEVEATQTVANSAFFTLGLNVYAYSKSDLRKSVATARNAAPLSCYYTTSAYNNYNKMASSSKLKAALNQLGYYVTTQFDITTAQKALDNAYSTMNSTGTRGGTYCVVHQKHVGDINTPITETAVDYFVFEEGASNNLRFKNDYMDNCNKHSATYTANLVTPGTYTHIYDYWNIDFSSLESVLDEYNVVAEGDKFSNTEEAAGNQLTAAQAVDMTSSTPLPENQNDVEVVATELKNALRGLVYTSFDMSVTHKMVTPTGDDVTDPEVAQYTEIYNKTATYGEVLDGTADINDSTYTIKGVHYAPIPDEKFLSYSSKYRTSGISSGYIVKESKTITFTYTAKPIEDTELNDAISDFTAHAEEWKNEFTKSSFDEFTNWFVQNEETLTQAFSIFDEDAYEQILAMFREESAKLDPIITQEQIAALESFNEEYEMLEMMPQAYCYGRVVLNSFSQTYNDSKAILELVDENDAGKNAAQAILDQAADFAPTVHAKGDRIVITDPLDGMAGSYATMCATCNQRISANSLPNPVFNTAVQSYYDYSNRGAALCYSEEEALSPDTQHIRFPASCVVPAGATVEDFGFVYTYTMHLNGGAEPNDNTPVNVDSLIIGEPLVTQKSVFNSEDPHYTAHPQADGSTAYTFNLKFNSPRKDWNKHYAVRSYVTYNYDGVSVTVYDRTYSSRSASYVAKCVMDNPNELEAAKQIIGTKFGYSYK